MLVAVDLGYCGALPRWKQAALHFCHTTISDWGPALLPALTIRSENAGGLSR